MYIEFALPTSGPSLAPAHANHIINQHLEAWSEKYDVPYITKTHKYMKRVTFEDDTHYSLFAMTWNPEKRYHILGKWRIVSDLNNKSSFDSVL